MPQKKPKSQEYTAKDIQSLTPREHFRRRPGMYVGGTDKRALHHLIWAATDHMIEEAMAGLCSTIYVQLLENNKILIENDSAFLLHGKDSVDSASTMFSDLLTEFMWRNSVSEMYFGVQGDLHSIGLAIVNCLSETFSLEIQRKADSWSRRYQQGIVLEGVQYQKIEHSDKERTRIILTPDYSIMDKNDFDFDTIATRFRDLSYLMPHIAFQVNDALQQMTYFSYRGLADWVADMNKSTPLHDVISGSATCEFVDKAGNPYKTMLRFAFQFTASYMTEERSFINTVPTPDGGTHIEALQQAILGYVFADYSQLPQWENVSMGFVGVVHLLHPDPQFEGRTRMKITNSDAFEIVEVAMKQAIDNDADSFEIVRSILNSRL